MGHNKRLCLALTVVPVLVLIPLALAIGNDTSPATTSTLSSPTTRADSLESALCASCKLPGWAGMISSLIFMPAVILGGSLVLLGKTVAVRAFLSLGERLKTLHRKTINAIVSPTVGAWVSLRCSLWDCVCSAHRSPTAQAMSSTAHWHLAVSLILFAPLALAAPAPSPTVSTPGPSITCKSWIDPNNPNNAVCRCVTKAVCLARLFGMLISIFGAIGLWWLFLDWAYNPERYRDLTTRLCRGAANVGRGVGAATAWTWHAIVTMATSPWNGAKRAATATRDGVADAARAGATSLSKIIPRRPDVIVPQPFGPLQSDMDTESQIRDSEAAFGDVKPLKTKKDKSNLAEFDDARSYSTVAPSYHTKDGATAPSYASSDPQPPPSTSAPTYRSDEGPYLASRASSPPGSIYSEVESLGEVPDVVSRGVQVRPPRPMYRLSRMGVPTFTSPYCGTTYLATPEQIELMRGGAESGDTASSAAGSGVPLLARRGHDSV